MEQYDVSIILPFRDDEEVIGTAVARLANFTREQGLTFEIVAVDDDSRDNSQAVLALIRTSYPELKVTHTQIRGHGFEHGAKTAKGQVLWFIEPHMVLASLSEFTQALAIIQRGEQDLIAVQRQFIVAHRARCQHIIKDLYGHGSRFRRRLVRRARRRGLEVETPQSRLLRRPALRWAAPLIAALSSTTRPSS